MIAAAAMSAWVGILIALPLTSPASLHVSPLQLAQLALFGVTSFGLGLILYTIGARHLHAARSALISALDTPLAPLWVWLAFGLRPALASVIGGGIRNPEDALMVARRAVELGFKVLACASTGNTSASLAMFASLFLLMWLGSRAHSHAVLPPPA